MRIRYTLAVLIAIFAVLTLFDRFILIELLVRRAAIPLLVAKLWVVHPHLFA